LTTAPELVDHIPKNVDHHKIFAQILPYLKKTYYFCSQILKPREICTIGGAELKTKDRYMATMQERAELYKTIWKKTKSLYIRPMMDRHR